MAMKQKPSRSATLAVLAMLAIVAAYGQARSEELPISPSSSDVAAQLKQAEQPSIALVPNGGNGNTSKAVPSRGATDRDGSVRIGESSIGIKTDGDEQLSAEQCRALFSRMPLLDRQLKVIERIEGETIVDIGCPQRRVRA